MRCTQKGAECPLCFSFSVISRGSGIYITRSYKLINFGSERYPLTSQLIEENRIPEFGESLY